MQFIYSLKGINFKNTGALSLGAMIYPTTPFIANAVVIACTSVSGFNTAATISVGTNASSYNNVLAATALTGLITSGNYIILPISIGSVVASTAELFLNITVGANATTFVGAIAVEGFTR